ncbi:transcriptional repressor NrdR [bacterium]|jgi:transcriptional repressor NrdR|nr:transcriptional repressor NrdR [bacterium]MBT4251144.1 transcriptional repressor NrdR [bacterium]MBT4598064.1 transcriptional repressor NrdR [bacterium]MBT6753407.1 transcriptional repressor NrdR [bacterium]MBT7038120.1 transcriptional repressor NrdR [bacterium]
MKCPYCGHKETKVVDSREIEDGKTIRRRRECEKVECKLRFSTYEQIETLNSTVLKRDGQKEEYKREKLEESIRRATNKRLEESQIAQIISSVESELRTKGKCEMTAKEIGEVVLTHLKTRDEVSYLRFASVFKSFGTGKRFVKELDKLEEKE